jgi:RNA polymerase sigma factor (sigma-70 family)
MFLLGKKAKPGSTRYPYGKNPPPPITEERLTELIVKLKAGDKSVIDEIVTGHLRLAVYIAACYGSLEPRKSKDLVGEASLALIKACHDIDKMKTDSFGKFVCYRVHDACGRFVLRDRLIPLTDYARYKAGQKDKQIMANREVADREMNPLNKMILDETIQSAVQTEEEQKIFELKCAEYSFKEIEELTGIKHTTAHRIFDVVKKRFIRNEET